MSGGAYASIFRYSDAVSPCRRLLDSCPVGQQYFVDNCGVSSPCLKGSSCCCNGNVYLSKTGCSFCCDDIGCDASSYWSFYRVTLPYGCYSGGDTVSPVTCEVHMLCFDSLIHSRWHPVLVDNDTLVEGVCR